MSDNKKKGGSPIMEWLSDNLRYIILGAAIFGVLALLFFGVRAISSRVRGNENAAGKTESTAGADTQSAGTDTAPAAIIETGADHGTLSAADADIVTLIEAYYQAMGSRDVAGVQAVTDTLPADQIERINASNVTYSGVRAYVKNGPDADSRVVYVYYQYRDGSSGTVMPGLSQMLIRKGADGAWKIVYSTLTESEQSYIEAVTSDADVQALIALFRTEYASVESTVAAASADTAAGSAQPESGNTETAQAAAEQDGTAQETASEDEDNDEETSPDAEAEEETIDENLIGQEYRESAEASEDADRITVEEGNSAEEAPAQGHEGEEWTASVNTSCNVRSGAGYDYSVVGGVTQGTEVTVIGDIVDGWWHIRTGGIEGYIGGQFID
ncbi:MAG: SH3 domain-containing protein [Lachnospiraceae bacterium]|nr:SH3 domain-containing protein [Lachnospiraceae bacterium]